MKRGEISDLPACPFHQVPTSSVVLLPDQNLTHVPSVYERIFISLKRQTLIFHNGAHVNRVGLDIMSLLILRFLRNGEVEAGAGAGDGMGGMAAFAFFAS